MAKAPKASALIAGEGLSAVGHDLDLMAIDLEGKGMENPTERSSSASRMQSGESPWLSVFMGGISISILRPIAPFQSSIFYAVMGRATRG